MNKKNEFFWNLAVVIAGILILSFILGGCGKKDKEDSESETEQSEKEPTPQLKPLDGSEEPEEELSAAAKERLEKLQKDVPELTEMQKIIINAKTWNPIMQDWYGKDAPDNLLQDIKGKVLRISGFEGKEVIILKWSTTVEPSRAMLDDLVEINSGNEDLKIIAISTERASQLPDYNEIQNVSLVPGPHKLVDPYRSVRAIPGTIFIGSDGKIKLIASNKIPKDVIEKIIETD